MRGPLAIGSDQLVAEDVSVLTPEGRCVVDGFNIRVAAGERVLVLGSTGRGKSMLVRALAGVWSHMSGHMEVPDDCMFVQGFSFPAMSLRRLMSYPHDVVSEVEPALRKVGLARLCEDLGSLDVVHQWEEVLSREMQDRVQFARVLLRKPRFVVLDEPLASLDVEEVNLLLQLIPENAAVLTFSRRRLSMEHVVELEDPAAQQRDQDVLGATSAANSSSSGPSAGVLQVPRTGQRRQSAQPAQQRPKRGSRPPQQ